jgi:hypothetical protein
MIFCRLLQPIWLEQTNHYLAHIFCVLWGNIKKHALRFEHLSCYIFVNYIFWLCNHNAVYPDCVGITEILQCLQRLLLSVPSLYSKL